MFRVWAGLWIVRRIDKSVGPSMNDKTVVGHAGTRRKNTHFAHHEIFCRQSHRGNPTPSPIHMIEDCRLEPTNVSVGVVSIWCFWV
jgi:hypothetical protein